ncbi:restriction endonuclease [Escherichia coli]|nr:restriction endonuclease [Escherichia coli]TJM63775.1 restriction endonuclease [Escherichia coli]TJM73690.1 restriction endonuclease [Escherichia coli]
MNDAGDGFELLMSGNMQDFNICCRRDNHYPEHKLIPLSHRVVIRVACTPC